MFRNKANNSTPQNTSSNTNGGTKRSSAAIFDDDFSTNSMMNQYENIDDIPDDAIMAELAKLDQDTGNHQGFGLDANIENDPDMLTLLSGTSISQPTSTTIGKTDGKKSSNSSTIKSSIPNYPNEEDLLEDEGGSTDNISDDKLMAMLLEEEIAEKHITNPSSISSSSSNTTIYGAPNKRSNNISDTKPSNTTSINNRPINPSNSSTSTTIALSGPVKAMIQKLNDRIQLCTKKANEYRSNGREDGYTMWMEEAQASQRDIELLKNGTSIQIIQQNIKDRTSNGGSKTNSSTTAATSMPTTSTTTTSRSTNLSSTSTSTTIAADKDRLNQYAKLQSSIKQYLVDRNKNFQEQKTSLETSIKSNPSSVSKEEIDGLKHKAELLVKERKEYDNIIKLLDDYINHPSKPKCPTWDYTTVTDKKELQNNDIPNDGIQIQILQLKKLVNKSNQIEKGEVSILYNFPIPVGKEITGRTVPAKKLDADGNVEDIQYEAMHHISKKVPTTIRGFERKCVVFEIERKSIGVFGLFGSTEIVAKGALPLESLLSTSILECKVPLHPATAPITIDGFNGKKTRDIASDFTGPCGTLNVRIRLSTPIKEPAIQLIEYKKPIITHWPTITAVVTNAPTPATIPTSIPVVNTTNAMPATIPSSTPSVSTVTSASTASAIAPSSNALAITYPNGYCYQTLYPTLTKLNINCYSSEFLPDALIYYNYCMTLLGAEPDHITEAIELINNKNKAVTAKLTQLRNMEKTGPPKTITDETEIQKWSDDLQSLLFKTQTENQEYGIELQRLSKRYEAIAELYKITEEQLNNGTITQPMYLANLPEGIQRDFEMAQCCIAMIKNTSIKFVNEMSVEKRKQLRIPVWCISLLQHPGTNEWIYLRFDPRIGKNECIFRAKKGTEEKTILDQNPPPAEG